MIATKVLIIDDEEAFVSALEKRLSKRDMEVSSALAEKKA